VPSLDAAVSQLESALRPEDTSIFKSVDASREVAAKPPTAAPEGPEANRFTDVALYAGLLFPTDDLSKETKIADTAPLVGGNDYTLEVAIRLRRTGIAAEQKADRPVLNPPPAKIAGI
jgi:hypothetical protein